MLHIVHAEWKALCVTTWSAWDRKYKVKDAGWETTLWEAGWKIWGVGAHSFYIKLTQECWQRSERGGEGGGHIPSPSPWVNPSTGCADVAMECQPSRGGGHRKEKRKRRTLHSSRRNFQKATYMFTNTHAKMSWGRTLVLKMERPHNKTVKWDFMCILQREKTWQMWRWNNGSNPSKLSGLIRCTNEPSITFGSNKEAE